MNSCAMRNPQRGRRKTWFTGSLLLSIQDALVCVQPSLLIYQVLTVIVRDLPDVPLLLSRIFATKHVSFLALCPVRRLTRNKPFGDRPSGDGSLKQSDVLRHSRAAMCVS